MKLLFARYRWLLPALCLLSISITVLQSVICPTKAIWPLWVNWVAAGIFAWGIQNIISFFRIGQIDGSKTGVVAGCLLATSLNFGYLFSATSAPAFWLVLLEQFGFLLLHFILLGMWQQRYAPISNLLAGTIVGLLTFIQPSALYWILFFPMAYYNMRCSSWRNMFCALTGVLLAFWVVYATLFIGISESTAQATLLQIIQSYHIQLPEIANRTLWQLLFAGTVLLTLIGYGISNLIHNTGDSIRAHSSIAQFSTIGWILIGLTIIDFAYFPHYLSLLTELLVIQISLHLANVRSTLGECCAIVILLIMCTLNIMPLFLNI